MILDYQKLHKDVLKKLNRLNLSQREASNKIGISRTTLFRISNKKTINLNTYLVITDWLENDLEHYINREKRPNYIEKRLKTLSD